MPNASQTAAQRLVFTGKQAVQLDTYELPPIAENEVRIRTHVSLMSIGTENIVFNRLFDPGTHWDNWVKYPFHPGYCNVGTVEAAGAAVTALKPGDRVAYRSGHTSHANVDAASCYPIPDGLEFEKAVWFALAKIAFHGAKVAEYHLGDSVLIIGAGPIGQMSVRWAHAAGAAAIIVADSLSTRLCMAQAGGATATIANTIEAAREEVLAGNGGELPRVVIDSTGNAAVFAAAQGLAAQYGRVVVLGDTGRPGQQHLTSDVIMRGLTIVGAHDCHNTPEWNEASITRLFFALASTGRFSLDGLNTHAFKPAECEEAYAVANRDRAHTMGILFNWSL
ncbi:MAG: zinc-binding dehydrogenase [Chthoniobacteraceae bacterium]